MQTVCSLNGSRPRSQSQSEYPCHWRSFGAIRSTPDNHYIQSYHRVRPRSAVAACRAEIAADRSRKLVHDMTLSSGNVQSNRVIRVRVSRAALGCRSLPRVGLATLTIWASANRDGSGPLVMGGARNQTSRAMKPDTIGKGLTRGGTPSAPASAKGGHVRDLGTLTQPVYLLAVAHNFLP